MEVSRASADSVQTRENVESSRRNWKVVIAEIAECPQGSAIIVDTKTATEKALKQARWNLTSACKNAVEDGKLPGMPEIRFGKEPGTLIVIPAARAVQDTAEETAEDTPKHHKK